MPDTQHSAGTAQQHAIGETIAVAPPCAMVIFGAAGDLAKRLPEGFRIVGVDHGRRTVDEWRKSLTDMMNQFVASSAGEFHTDRLDQQAWQWLVERMSYVQGEFQDP